MARSPWVAHNSHVDRLRLPARVGDAARQSIGAALEVAGRVGGRAGGTLADADKAGFSSGIEFATLVGAVIVLAAVIVVVVFLPNRPGDQSPDAVDDQREESPETTAAATSA